MLVKPIELAFCLNFLVQLSKTNAMFNNYLIYLKRKHKSAPLCTKDHLAYQTVSRFT